VTGKKILVVEDDSIQRTGLLALLEQQGYTVQAAADGKTALDLLRNGLVPDLIILDMMIPPPDCDGWHFLEKQRKMPAAAPIPVVITTSLSVASQEWAASLGACCLIRKPIEVEPMLASIQACLASRP
jgi:CheY-like chemotaxis protein